MPHFRNIFEDSTFIKECAVSCIAIIKVSSLVYDKPFDGLEHQCCQERASRLRQSASVLAFWLTTTLTRANK